MGADLDVVGEVVRRPVFLVIGDIFTIGQPSHTAVFSDDSYTKSTIHLVSRFFVSH